MIVVSGKLATHARIHVPRIGPWFAEIDLVDDDPLEGEVTITIGEVSFSGTIRSDRDGTFGLRRKTLIVGGADGWGDLLDAKAYHNDAGVRAATIAEDAAAEAGETIGDFEGPDKIGIDYVRSSGPASQAIIDAAGGVPWFVDFDGVTHVKERESSPSTDSYEVLSYDPRDRMAVLAVEEVDAILPGAVLSKGVDDPLEVGEVEISVTPEKLRIFAYCNVIEKSQLGDALSAIVEKISGEKLHGIYRYRVRKMSGDRVDLQVVNQSSGVPDLLTISMAPGIAGAHAKLTAGAIAFVQFVAGDRKDPVITGFGGKESPGFVPDRLDLGGDAASDAARKGDTVEILLPPAVFSGTIGGSPASGVLTFTTSKTQGSIITGSSKVGVAT